MLADFIREELDLTGTHLGCEHGICGACTVSIDGQAARSCVTLARACAGAQVVTIEGFDNDLVMGQLRQAFTEEHALQCGFCTPGMLIAARDLVLRHPEADEEIVRLEMSGNLCRCTGYVGIVNAILRVLKERREQQGSSPAYQAAPLGPVGSYGPPVRDRNEGSSSTGAVAVPLSSKLPSAQGVGRSGRKPSGSLTNLAQVFTVDFPIEQVWAFFSQLEIVGRCLPGLSLEQSPGSPLLKILLRVRAGPIIAEFDGSAEVVQNEETRSGRILGDALDQRSGTNAHGDIRYQLTSVNEGRSTQVDIDLGYVLAGPLAQFSRGAIAKDIARKLTEAFAENLRSDLLNGTSASAHSSYAARELNAAGLVWSVIKSRTKDFLARLFGRRS
jgi:carbon-monoxide dehydrogenase small subunit